MNIKAKRLDTDEVMVSMSIIRQPNGRVFLRTYDENIIGSEIKFINFMDIEVNPETVEYFDECKEEKI